MAQQEGDSSELFILKKLREAKEAEPGKTIKDVSTSGGKDGKVKGTKVVGESSKKKMEKQPLPSAPVSTKKRIASKKKQNEPGSGNVQLGATKRKPASSGGGVTGDGFGPEGTPNVGGVRKKVMKERLNQQTPGVMKPVASCKAMLPVKPSSKGKSKKNEQPEQLALFMPLVPAERPVIDTTSQLYIITRQFDQGVSTYKKYFQKFVVDATQFDFLFLACVFDQHYCNTTKFGSSFGLLNAVGHAFVTDLAADSWEQERQSWENLFLRRESSAIDRILELYNSKYDVRATSKDSCFGKKTEGKSDVQINTDSRTRITQFFSAGKGNLNFPAMFAKFLEKLLDARRVHCPRSKRLEILGSTITQMAADTAGITRPDLWKRRLIVSDALKSLYPGAITADDPDVAKDADVLEESGETDVVLDELIQKRGRILNVELLSKELEQLKNDLAARKTTNEGYQNKLNEGLAIQKKIELKIICKEEEVTQAINTGETLDRIEVLEEKVGKSGVNKLLTYINNMAEEGVTTEKLQNALLIITRGKAIKLGVEITDEQAKAWNEKEAQELDDGREPVPCCSSSLTKTGPSTGAKATATTGREENVGGDSSRQPLIIGGVSKPVKRKFDEIEKGGENQSVKISRKETGAKARNALQPGILLLSDPSSAEEEKEEEEGREYSSAGNGDEEEKELPVTTKNGASKDKDSTNVLAQGDEMDVGAGEGGDQNENKEGKAHEEDAPALHSKETGKSKTAVGPEEVDKERMLLEEDLALSDIATRESTPVPDDLVSEDEQASESSDGTNNIHPDNQDEVEGQNS